MRQWIVNKWFLILAIIGIIVILGTLAMAKEPEKMTIITDNIIMDGATTPAEILCIDDGNSPVFKQNCPELKFTSEGRVFINGKLIEQMDYPEIRDSIKKIAESMKKDSENNGMINFLSSQTEYLLQQLEECQQKVYSEIENMILNKVVGKRNNSYLKGE